MPLSSDDRIIYLSVVHQGQEQGQALRTPGIYRLEVLS